MYLGWNDREQDGNSYCAVAAGTYRAVLNNSAICEAIESCIVADAGEKLLEKPDEVGEESLQFKAQQSRAIDAIGDSSLPSALGQQSGISFLSE